MLMTHRMVAAAVLALSLVVFGAVAWETGGNVALAQSNCSTGSAGLSSSEAEMILLINAARAQNGAGPLLASPALNQAAAWMAGDFNPGAPSHTDSLGRGPSQRAQDCGYPGQAAENIAWGYGSANSAFNGWMNSSGHRANILNPSYQVIGVGQVGSTWVANFGLTVDSGAFEVTGGSPPPPPPPTQQPTATPTPFSLPTNPPSSNPPPPAGGAGNPAAPQPTNTPVASPTQYWNPDARVYPGVVPRIKVPMLARQ